MCGIAGLFAKSPAIEAALGAHLAGMIEPLGDRGPDSAGVAIYRAPVADDEVKLSLYGEGWRDVPGARVLADHGDQGIVAAPVGTEVPPGVTLLSAGTAIETTKREGPPTALIDTAGLRGLDGTHAVAHTRMATESRVTTLGSHPFSTGPDLCLVHNGSLSNHNALRRRLRGYGVTFQSENDSEVAAGYLTWRLREGDTLDEALHAALDDLDGFFTFCVGTRDGFAVLRDPFACKPAVLAETDDWVAMASEHRAIATLPGADDAELWEPEPGRVYTWSHNVVAA
ncbi:MAG: hypothetical protein JHC95_18665 [Solirubrobacteraceae bacterium]|nr:hypothetical protein [Solirubrobacteraceae bacterium]